MRHTDLLERIGTKFTVGDGCWEWTGAKSLGGYGQLNRVREGGSRYAHRIVYELLVGPVPEGLDLDHLCRNRACVRPSHLEPVTRQENVLRGEGTAAQHARKTHCMHGHEFTEENTYMNPKGFRACRTCIRVWGATSRARARFNALALS